MIRDELMESVIAADKEPIVPFIKRVGQLYKENGISTILVVGSCGAFFHVADTVIQMERYLPKEITTAAKAAAQRFPLTMEPETGTIILSAKRKIRLPKLEERNKIKVMGTDGFSFGRKNVDLRYLEQITDGEQMLAIAKSLEYICRRYGGKEMELLKLVDEVDKLLKRDGISRLCEGNVIPNMAMPRRMEIAGCLNRFFKPVH